MVASLVLAPAALAQVRGPSGADGSYNCEDFDTQPQAQAFYDAQGGVAGGDPDGLDDDSDGTACDTLPPGEETPPAEMGGDEPVVEEQPATEMQYETPETPSVSGTETDLPETGGPAILLPAAGLLLAAGLLGLKVVRRRS